jgi:hypothetical protein
MRFNIFLSLRRLLHSRIPFRLPTASQTFGGLAILALTFLGFVLGAAVMHFQLPSSDVMRLAFIGAQAWTEREFAENHPGDAVDPGWQTSITADHADKTFDGFTLFTSNQTTEAALVDMRGNVVHQWQLPFSRAWINPPHILRPLTDNRVHWVRCHLYPNGDLLAVYQAIGDTPYGYGLAKLDKDSQVLWTYAANVHHDVDVGEDGTIYTLTHKIVKSVPAGLEWVPTPYLADYLVVLSPEGAVLKEIPILEAFRDSPYALLLTSIDAPIPTGRLPQVLGRDFTVQSKEIRAGHLPPLPSDGPLPTDSNPPLPLFLQMDSGIQNGNPNQKYGDLLHANSVKVLNSSVASAFPLSKPGQVLVSLRNLDTIAILDTQTSAVTWATHGLWRKQHDAEFLPNGHILVYDNLGFKDCTRLIEYDPVTQAVPWCYANESSTPFIALVRGMKQRLANGNTLFVDPDSLRIVEVTPRKELAWELRVSTDITDPLGQDSGPALTGAQRFKANELLFLEGDVRARP